MASAFSDPTGVLRDASRATARAIGWNVCGPHAGDPPLPASSNYTRPVRYHFCSSCPSLQITQTRIHRHISIDPSAGPGIREISDRTSNCKRLREGTAHSTVVRLLMCSTCLTSACPANNNAPTPNPNVVFPLVILGTSISRCSALDPVWTDISRPGESTFAGEKANYHNEAC